jgi:hypothetical protein
VTSDATPVAGAGLIAAAFCLDDGRVGGWFRWRLTPLSAPVRQEGFPGHRRPKGDCGGNYNVEVEHWLTKLLEQGAYRWLAPYSS